jgi:hypothetical protein
MLIYDGSGHNDLRDAPMVDDIIRFVENSNDAQGRI